MLSQQSEEVFAAAGKAIEALGWVRVTQDTLPNTQEATDTTAWFGFKDDVVIRLTAENDDNLVDEHSKSRVGKSDLGINAERINTFVAELRKQLEITKVTICKMGIS